MSLCCGPDIVQNAKGTSVKLWKGLGQSLERGCPAIRGGGRTLVGGRAGGRLSLYESAAQKRTSQLPESPGRLRARSPPLAHHVDPAPPPAAAVAAAEPRPLQSPPSPSLAVTEQQRLARSRRTPGSKHEREQAPGDWKDSMRPLGAASAPKV